MSTTGILSGVHTFGSWPDHPLRRGDEHTVVVRFAEPFARAPAVSHAFCLLDTIGGKNVRLDTWVSGVRADQFTLHARCWDDSVTWQVQVAWTAVAAEQAHVVQTGVTAQQASWPHHPIVRDAPTRVRVAFAQPFAAGTVPHVVLGLCMLDIDAAAVARLRTASENVSAAGFDLVCSTWLDSRVWGCKIAWTAVAADARATVQVCEQTYPAASAFISKSKRRDSESNSHQRTTVPPPALTKVLK